MSDGSYVAVITTTDSLEMAEKIGNYLLDEGLCACVQFHQITSMHNWDGRKKEPEYRLVINTVSELVEEIEHAIKEIHNYKLPQIITVPLAYVSKDYGSWVSQNTRITSK